MGTIFKYVDIVHIIAEQDQTEGPTAIDIGQGDAKGVHGMGNDEKLAVRWTPSMRSFLAARQKSLRSARADRLAAAVIKVIR